MNIDIDSTVKKMLCERANEGDLKLLNDLGFKPKGNKLNVMIAGLYKKALGGDVSAYKQLIAHIENNGENTDTNGVIIVDDIPNRADENRIS